MGYLSSTLLVIAFVDPTQSVAVTLRRLVASLRSGLVGMLPTSLRDTQHPPVHLDRECVSRL
jgi:hypothetical protein